VKTITKRVKIDVSAGRVWDVLEDFGKVKPWGPTVIESYISDKGKKNKRVGMMRVLRHHSKKEVEEVVTAWQERKGFTVAFPGVVGSLKSYSQEWSLEGNKDEAQVTVVVRYELKWGFFGNFLNFIVFKKHFNRELALALAGLKHYVETGEEVDMKSKNLPISAVEFKK
jgi:hypothetical protein